MLVAILFNSGGYDLFFRYMIGRSDNKIINRINQNHYRNSDLVEVKIPVNLPTLQDWTEYEQVSGQVQFKNNKYNYAEIKMTRDTLYLLVIPNHDRTKLTNANIIYAKQINDIPINKNSHNSSVKKNTSESEYLSVTASGGPKLAMEDSRGYRNYAYLNIIQPFLDVPGKPPETSSIPC